VKKFRSKSWLPICIQLCAQHIDKFI